MTNSPNPGGAEKRKFKRASASFPVTYSIQSPFELRLQIGKQEVAGIADDLSQGGLSLLTNYDIPAGAVILIKFRLTSKSGPSHEERSRKFELEGEARHSSFSKENGYRIGIRFVNISESDRYFIAEYV